MFVGIESEKEFLHLSSTNQVRWIFFEGTHKNSLIEIGWHHKKKKFVRKKIYMANIDFDKMTAGIDDTLMASNEYSVFREILVLHHIMALFEKYPWDYKLQTSFMSISDEKPLMNLIFNYAGLSLSEFIQNYPHIFQRQKYSILYQIFVQNFLLNTISIHHPDIHWDNIMIKILSKPFCFSFQGIRHEIHCLATIIDFGCAYKNNSISNFENFLKFCKHMPPYSSLHKLQSSKEFFERISMLI